MEALELSLAINMPYLKHLGIVILKDNTISPVKKISLSELNNQIICEVYENYKTHSVADFFKFLQSIISEKLDTKSKVK